jgi:hypothetical protein
VRSGGAGPGAPGITYTLTGAAGMMKPVTVTGGVGMLGQQVAGNGLAEGTAGGNSTGGKRSVGARGRGISVVGLLVGVVVGVGIVQGL